MAATWRCCAWSQHQLEVSIRELTSLACPAIGAIHSGHPAAQRPVVLSQHVRLTLLKSARYKGVHATDAKVYKNLFLPSTSHIDFPMNTNLLRLPAGADRIFDQCRSLPRQDTKLLVYGLAGSAGNLQDQDIERLCSEATALYQANEADDEYEGQTFIMPAPKDHRFPGATVQEIVDHHVAFVSDIINNAGERQSTSNIFPYAFVVIEEAEWRKHGVTIVFCDDNHVFLHDEDGEETGWKLDECETNVLALGGFCQELVMDEDDWHSLLNNLGRPTARNWPPELVNNRPRAWSPRRISTADIAGSW